MLAHEQGDASESGTRCSKTWTLPHAVQRHDEARAKKAGAFAR